MRTNTLRFKLTSMIAAVLMVWGAVFAFAGTEVYAFSDKSPFDKVGYSKYNHNDRFADYMILDGVDVSEYQCGSKDNWATKDMNDVDFVLLRICWTGYSKSKHCYANKDTDFNKHYKGAKAAGKMVGIYVFSQAKTTLEARAEANYACSLLRSRGINPADLELPVYMDYEYAGSSSVGRLYGISKATATQCAIAFCETVKANGYTPGIYANTSFMEKTIDGAMLGNNYDLWVAQYYNKCQFKGNYSKWQYSSSAKISGIYNSKGNKTAVDVNYWYISRAPYNGSAVTVSGDRSFQYTGGRIRPAFKICYQGNVLRNGVDYSVGYFNNIKCGTAYAYVKGLGNYNGDMLIPFNIVDTSGYQAYKSQKNADFEAAVTSQYNSEVAAAEEENARRKAAAEEAVKQAEEASGQASETTEKVEDAVKEVAEDVTESSVEKIEEATETPEVEYEKVIPRTREEIADSIRSSWTYSVSVLGNGVKPAPTLAVSYPAPNPIKGTAIKKLKKGKKSFTVKVKKQSKKKVNGYQVRYSRNPNMTGSKIKTIGKKYNKVSRKVTKLKKKTKYYVQVRAYKKVNGTKQYSDWSSIKTVKTK